MSDEQAKDPVLDALWSRALEAWEEDKTHAALLEHALRTENLPDLAARYRLLKDDPDKRALAKKRLDAIVIAATQMLMTMKTPPKTGTPLWLNVSAGLVMLVILFALAYAMFKR